jgi:hypothetical protein
MIGIPLGLGTMVGGRRSEVADTYMVTGISPHLNGIIPRFISGNE